MIYVDDLRSWPESAYTNPRVRALGAIHKHLWCHLITDGADEDLHRFAERIGMKRSWAQRGKNGVLHYDLVPPRRSAALRLGAKEVTRKELVQIVRGVIAARPTGYVKLQNWGKPWDGVVRKELAEFPPDWDDGFGGANDFQRHPFSDSYDGEDD